MSDEKKPPRWYTAVDKRTGMCCLVEANNRAQAHRRVGEYYFNVAPATVAEAITMTREGGDVISAPTTPEQLDLEDDPALTNTQVLGTGPLEPASVVASPTDAAKGGSRSEGSVPSDPLTVPRRKAHEVFGAGFGPRSEPDVG